MSAADSAATKQGYPEHWGDVPAIQTMDMVALPDGFGEGSSTLKQWIETKLETDAAEAPPAAKKVKNVKGSGEPAMEIRTVEKAGLALSVLGFGAWQFGSTGGKDDYWGIDYTQEMADEFVALAAQGGTTYFDTAEAYNDGASEQQLGAALKKLPSQKGTVIGSKIPPNHCHPKAIREHLEATLQRLGVDCLDLYMVHWPIDANAMAHFASHGAIFGASDKVDPASVPDTKRCFATLMELQAEGKLKHVGVSNFGVKQLQEALSTGVTIAVNQVCYSLLWRAPEFEIIPFCQEQGIGVVCYMPLMQGLLTGRYATADDIPVFRARTRHFSGKRDKSRHGEDGQEALTFETLDKLKKISTDSGISMVALALAWPLHQKGVVSVVAGATKPEQIAGNIQGVKTALSADLLAQLNEATEALKAGLGPNCDLWQGNGTGRVQ